jgi:hypothetical protein
MPRFFSSSETSFSHIGVVLGFLFVSIPDGIALETETHALLNEYITRNQIGGFSLGNYLDNQLGFIDGTDQMIENLKVWELFARGGIYEVDPPGFLNAFLRSRNHFHNPLQPWDNAHYTVWLSYCDVNHCPVSAILWAQGPQTNR